MSPVVVRGRHLIDSVTQRRFFVKGSGYDYVSNSLTHSQLRLNSTPHCCRHSHLSRSLLCCRRMSATAIPSTGDPLSTLYSMPRRTSTRYAFTKVSQHTHTNTAQPPLRSPHASADSAPSRLHFSSLVVDPTLQYDDFMTAMNRRDIYVIVPLTPAKGWCTLNRNGTPPLTAQPTCYPSCLLTHAQHVVNLFHPYSNVLMFTVGNEILNSGSRWAAAACVKSFTRDVQRFMRQCETDERSRRVPLLYAAADNAMSGFTAEENDRLKSDYLTCGDDDDARIDVMGVNLFRYCSDTCTFHSCESNKVATAFTTASLPVLLTEYGCGDFTYHINHTVQAGVNPFTETAVLYSSLMAGTFSGGCAYTYGVRGGDSFAFFEGGGRSVSGETGLVKRCGYPDGLCRVDAYERQLAAVEEKERQREEKRHRAKLAGESAEELDESESGDEEGASPACPVVLGVDLTIADSRQGVDGYEEVGCQAGVGRSATVEEDRERQEHDREQQTLDKKEEGEKRRLAQQEDDNGDNAARDSEQPAVVAPEPIDGGETGQQQQQQQNESHARSSPSTSVPPLRSPDERQAGGSGDEEEGQDAQLRTHRQSTAESQSKLARWELLAFLCALVAV